jgi:hypothetical protein
MTVMIVGKERKWDVTRKIRLVQLELPFLPMLQNSVQNGGQTGVEVIERIGQQLTVASLLRQSLLSLVAGWLSCWATPATAARIQSDLSERMRLLLNTFDQLRTLTSTWTESQWTSTGREQWLRLVQLVDECCALFNDLA